MADVTKVKTTAPEVPEGSEILFNPEQSLEGLLVQHKIKLRN